MCFSSFRPNYPTFLTFSIQLLTNRDQLKIFFHFRLCACSLIAGYFYLKFGHFSHQRVWKVASDLHQGSISLKPIPLSLFSHVVMAVELPMKLYKNVRVVLTFGSSGFGRISKTTCDVSVVFASSSDMKCKFVPSNLPQ